MAEFVQLKPRIRIQTVIHFECPDRATFFAEYSRQLRRGEIFLEVAQKIPVGTIVDVRFRFQDCDATVELSGEIYRHRRKLDRLEAAVQFLDPDALQHLLSLSETDLGPGEASAITARLRDRLSEDDQVDLSVEGLAELEEQDTTKLPSLDAVPPGHNGERGALQRSMGSGSGVRRATSRPGTGPAEDEELENTKSLPSWGAHWLGIEGGGKPPQDTPTAPSQAQPASADDDRRSATAELRAGIADSSPIAKPSAPVPPPPVQADDGEVDMDEWDWNFLQSSPPPEPATIDEQPSFKPVPLDLSEDIGVDSLLGPPGHTPIPDSEDADPELVEFEAQAPEFEPDHPPRGEMDDAQLDAWTLEPAGTGDAPSLPDDPFASWSPKAAGGSSSNRHAELNSLLDPLIPDPHPASSPDAAGSGEWPSVEEPFRSDMEPLEPISESDDEFVEPRRSGLGSKVALLLVALLLLGGTAAVVLQPDWFSSLLGGGDAEDSGQDPRGSQQTRRATPVPPENQALIIETPAVTTASSSETESAPATPSGPEAESLASPSVSASTTSSEPGPTASTSEPETIDLDAEESGSRTAQVSVAALTPAAVEPTPRPAAPFRSPVPPTPSESSGLDEEPAPSGGPAALRGVDVAVDGQDVVLRIALVGAVDRVVQSEAASPPRLIFDLVQVSAPGAPSPRNVGQNGVERVRYGLHDSKLRIVVDVKGTLPRAEIVKNPGEVVIRLKPGA